MRSQSKNDRRKNEISLTKKGINLIKNIYPVYVLAIEKEFSTLNSQEQNTLGMICKKLLSEN